jgi:hypothetical protein
MKYINDIKYFSYSLILYYYQILYSTINISNDISSIWKLSFKYRAKD